MADRTTKQPLRRPSNTMIGEDHIDAQRSGLTQKLKPSGIGVERLDNTLTNVKETVSNSFVRSSTDRPEKGRGAFTSKSPDLNRKGGGTSAERARKEERDAYDDRVHDMHENIGKL